MLSSPVRGATVATKPQIVSRAQTGLQNVSTIRPGTAILHSAITIGHSFKPTQGASGIQGLSNAVTIAQVLPSRTQAVVYSAGGQFAAAPRLAGASTTAAQRQNPVVRPIVRLLLLLFLIF